MPTHARALARHALASRICVDKAPPLNLQQYCASRAATPAFAAFIRQQIISRTFDVVQWCQSSVAPKHNIDRSVDRTWEQLMDICDREFEQAAALPEVTSNSNIDAFLDGLCEMRSRQDVLSILLRLSPPREEVKHISSHRESNRSCAMDLSPLQSSHVDVENPFASDLWLSNFVAGRIKWHMLQEDFLRLCDGSGNVVEKECDVTTLVEEAAAQVYQMAESEMGIAPKLLIECDCDSLMMCGVGEQLRYIVTELVKNACVATVQSNSLHHPVLIEVRGPQSAPIASSHAASESSQPCFTIRIRDGAGGVPTNAIKHMWLLGWSGHNSQRRIAGFGVGLPLARVYAGLFGGSVDAASRTDSIAGTVLTVTHPINGIERVSS